MNCTAAQQHELLRLSHQSIVEGLRERRRTPYARSFAVGGLDRPGASFVTLRINDDLRGCCGSIEPRYSLGEDVWRNAWSSAFSDPRFPPLTPSEYDQCSVQISVLSELEPLRVADETELLEVLEPGVDGVLLQSGTRQATFLPAVWEQLPDPRDFLRHLRLKAGWSADAWPPDVRVFRYTTHTFGKTDA